LKKKQELVPLSAEDKLKLKEHETGFAAAEAQEKKSFLEKWKHLKAIKDGKLYRETHSSFEDYCKQRWNISRSHANRLIDAAKVVEEIQMSPMGDKSTQELPQNERQARKIKDASRAAVKVKVEPEPEHDLGLDETTDAYEALIDTLNLSITALRNIKNLSEDQKKEVEAKIGQLDCELGKK